VPAAQHSPNHPDEHCVDDPRGSHSPVGDSNYITPGSRHGLAKGEIVNYDLGRTPKVPMPELPEVEIMRRMLSRRLRGQRICRVEVRDPKIRLTDQLAGRRIVAIQRRAKFLIVRLAGGQSLLVHLRMTGWFEFAPPERWRRRL
jgi:hypothetical protein